MSANMGFLFCVLNIVFGSLDFFYEINLSIYKQNSSNIRTQQDWVFLMLHGFSYVRDLKKLRVRLSPFPRVETRFKTHNQNAFANAFRNAFLELLRLSSNSQNHDNEYTVRPRRKKKQTPETKGCCDQVPGTRGV